MIRMPTALRTAGLSARMLLQVHDELVFEAPDEEIEATLPVVAAVMVEAPEPAVRLHVPLQVEARARAKLGRGALASGGHPYPAGGAGHLLALRGRRERAR